MTNARERLEAESRCPFFAKAPEARRPREDGYRCGHDAGHPGNHELYKADGEGVLYAGGWVRGEGRQLRTSPQLHAEQLATAEYPIEEHMSIAQRTRQIGLRRAFMLGYASSQKGVFDDE
ncbi:hypothetical protein [Nesterenkonia pannonica]|uniref:hypothetical protein n=1 Tax=Nesterenkonia pannonica TaxID=1548602 RepID=UPI0021647A8D|nr:hypothetical protein [Nesterenkonia pannonica]